MTKTTTAPLNSTRISIESSSNPRIEGSILINRQNMPGQELIDLIEQAANGQGLMGFCRDLAVILVGHYSIDDDASDLRQTLVPILIKILDCEDDQANCLIDLSLEMIHFKIHGGYRRSPLELSYLIAIATGAVNDVAAN